MHRRRKTHWLNIRSVKEEYRHPASREGNTAIPRK
jgi:hypothetical protein